MVDASRAEAQLLLPFAIDQELLRDIVQRDVILRVIRRLPDVQRRRRVEDDLTGERPADPAWGGLDPADGSGHHRVTGGHPRPRFSRRFLRGARHGLLLVLGVEVNSGQLSVAGNAQFLPDKFSRCSW